MYQIIDAHTKQIVKTFDTAQKAHRYADRLDMLYGAVRYFVKFI